MIKTPDNVAPCHDYFLNFESYQSFDLTNISYPILFLNLEHLAADWLSSSGRYSIIP